MAFQRGARIEKLALQLPGTENTNSIKKATRKPIGFQKGAQIRDLGL